jgi:hypothetical protein
MAMEKGIVCTISFEPMHRILYSDDYGREAEGRIDTASLSWRTVGVLAKWVRDYGDRITREELELLGRHLYSLLLAGPVGKEFSASFKVFGSLNTDASATYKPRFRVELRFSPEALELANLPWEFMYIPQDEITGFFLAGERHDLVLTRLAPLNPGLPPLQSAERPLRVMVASCRHPEGASSDVEMVKTTILSMGTPDQIVVLESEDPDFDELRHQIETERPHILHIIGHGEPGGLIMKRKFRSDAERYAHSVDDDLSDVVTIAAETVRSLFDTHRPHMVFLHACDGDSAPSLTSIFSTAREVAYAAVPAVVAMQYQISVQDALEFVTTFYKEVGDGQPVSEAVKEGRRRLALNQQATGKRRDWSTRLFGTPVVYVQRDEPLVMARLAPPPAPGRVPAQEGNLKKCRRCGTMVPDHIVCCRKCGLRFKCECGATYDEPATDCFCGECTRAVSQPPWPVQGGDAAVPDRRTAGFGA